MSERQAIMAGIGILAAIASIVITVMLAVANRQGPARCPEGLVAQGARCCGDGQRESAGRCVGRALRCAETQTLTPDGCVAPPKRIAYPGGKALLGSPDWEKHEARATAGGVIAPYELDAYEVTQARYLACVSAGTCSAVQAGDPGDPVRSVTPEQAETFCR